MAAISKKLEEWNEKELEASKRPRSVIIWNRLYYLPKKWVVVCNSYSILDQELILPVGIGHLKPTARKKKSKGK